MRQRWFTALLVPGLFLAACSTDDGSEVVSAAKGAEEVAEVPLDSSSTSAPTSTTVPDVESTTTTSVPTTTSTTGPPTTTTTKPATTTTTFPANAVRLTLANDLPAPVDISIAPGKFHLAPGERVGPLAYVTPDHGNDVYTVVISGTDCGAGSAGGYFWGGAGHAATMRIVPQPLDHGGCEAAGPGVPYFKVVFERDGWVGVDG